MPGASPPDVSIPIFLIIIKTPNHNDYITYISADIKLPSATGLRPLWEEHELFFKVGVQKELFAKVAFDNNINDFEIHKITHLCKKYCIELILQPIMKGRFPVVDSEFMQIVLDKLFLSSVNLRLMYIFV